MKTSLAMTFGSLVLALSLAAPGIASAQADAGEVTVLTIIDVMPDYAVPGNVDASVAILDKLAADTRHAPGLLSFKVLRDASRPNHFVIQGEWKDMRSFEAYTGLETTRSFRQALQPRQGGPFDERVYLDLR